MDKEISEWTFYVFVLFPLIFQIFLKKFLLQIRKLLFLFDYLLIEKNKRDEQNNNFFFYYSL